MLVSLRFSPMSSRFDKGVAKRLLAVAVFACASFVAPGNAPHAAARHDAAAAYKAGDYRTAVRLFKEAAEAVRWYRKAAEQGDAAG